MSSRESIHSEHPTHPVLQGGESALLSGPQIRFFLCPCQAAKTPGMVACLVGGLGSNRQECQPPATSSFLGAWAWVLGGSKLPSENLAWRTSTDHARDLLGAWVELLVRLAFALQATYPTKSRSNTILTWMGRSWVAGQQHMLPNTQGVKQVQLVGSLGKLHVEACCILYVQSVGVGPGPFKLDEFRLGHSVWRLLIETSCLS